MNFKELCAKIYMKIKEMELYGMNRKHLNQIFEAYIDKFQHMNSHPACEYYKWSAILEFQEVFDLEAPDFHAMLKRAKQATRNVIDSFNQPFGGLVKFAEKEPETVRTMFRALFVDDGGDLVIRKQKIDAFLADCDILLDKYSPGSYLYKNDLRSAMGYLFFHDPDHHYLYKATEATYLADCVEFYDDWGTMSHFKMDIWHRFCDELIKEIRATPEIIETHKSRYVGRKRPMHPDTELHVLLFDIIYCAHTYGLYSGINVVRITSSSRKLYLENKKKAQELYAAVEKAESDSALLEDAYRYFTEAINTNATVTHKMMGDLEVTQLEHEQRTGALMIHVRVKKNGDRKVFMLLSVIATGFVTIDVPDFTEKVAAYKPVMLKELSIPQALTTANKNLQPYADYLD